MSPARLYSDEYRASRCEAMHDAIRGGRSNLVPKLRLVSDNGPTQIVCPNCSASIILTKKE